MRAGVGILVVAACLALGVPAAGFTRMTGHWEIEAGKDPVSDAPLLKVELLTWRLLAGGGSGDVAKIGLQCLGGEPMLRIGWSHRAIGKKNLIVDYRFDGRPGRVLNAEYVNPQIARVTRKQDIRTFLDDIRSSDALIVRVQSDARGESIAWFTALSGPNAVEAFTAACPSVAP